MEADLRRPKISEYLRLESAVGLTTVLIGRLGLNEAIQYWGEDQLAVLTSGAIPPNPPSFSSHTPWATCSTSSAGTSA